MGITRQQYESAAQAYLSKNPQLVLKYYNPTLLKTLCDAMQSSLPTTVAAGIAFNRLVADGKIERTDGKSEADDRVEAMAAAQANLDSVIAEVDARPLTKDELDYFGSLGQRELSRLYYGADGDAVCEFAVRYNRACRDFGFVPPPRFSDQGSR
jgi:hypothetical protein